MQALRETVKVKERNYSIRLPEWAVGQEVEVIILPVARRVGVEAKGESLNRFAGAWKGDSMVRENEGSYEVRDNKKNPIRFWSPNWAE